jgi:hypothetical protein
MKIWEVPAMSQLEVEQTSSATFIDFYESAYTHVDS